MLNFKHLNIPTEVTGLSQKYRNDSLKSQADLLFVCLDWHRLTEKYGKEWRNRVLVEER